MYGVGSLVSTYYASGSRITGATSLMQDLFPSQATFESTVERIVQSRLDIVRSELHREYNEQRSELHREYDEQRSKLRRQYNDQVRKFQ